MFGFNGDYLDTRFYKINVSSSAYVVGDPLELVPKYQFTFTTQRDFQWEAKPTFARLDYNQQGRETDRNRSYGPQYFGESDVITMLNFNLGVHWSDQLEFSVFAQ